LLCTESHAYTWIMRLVYGENWLNILLESQLVHQIYGGVSVNVGVFVDVAVSVAVAVEVGVCVAVAVAGTGVSVLVGVILGWGMMIST